MVEEDKDAVAYCGLCCSDCFSHAGKIADLARDLRKELRAYRFDGVAKVFAAGPFKAFAKYDDCYGVLGAMVKLRCNRACRGGGGPPQCNIRNCCRNKEIAGCWECADFGACKKLDFLKPSYGDAHIRNLRALKAKGPEAFLRENRDW
ncbi:MAG: hypothetical protein CVT48_02730 [Thermoplasmata archaeon HGW-Thermoplasmata-1]|nr:MAG: hypothetical protein CVT48_02730 [Thermoplasmata archaeon HGW-Thermoplasmata-1]